MRWEIWLVQGLALLGLLLANFDRLHLTGRLRQNVVAQQAIVKDLPEGGMARRELQEHIDRQVRLMVVEQEPATPDERNDNRWSLAFIGLGFLLPWTLLEGVDVESHPGYLMLAGLASVALIAAGLYQNMRAGRSRNYRKWAGRMAVDRGKPWDRESRELARAAPVTPEPESDRAL
jgi:hypothetical protein